MTAAGGGLRRIFDAISSVYEAHYQASRHPSSWIPASAGTPRYENTELRFLAANQHGGLCHAQTRRQRGTSPSPREVFDRTTFPIPTPLDSGLRRNDEWGAGMTSGEPKRRVREPWNAGTLEAAKHHFRTNHSSRLAPAHQDIKTQSCGIMRRIRRGGLCHAQARPQRGTSPSTTLFRGLRDADLPILPELRAEPDHAEGHFRTNRSCRLQPAHQGMKIRSRGLVRRIRAWDSATPRPDPSGGQAPALHWPWGDWRRFLDLRFAAWDSCVDWWVSKSRLKAHNTIFVPMTIRGPERRMGGRGMRAHPRSRSVILVAMTDWASSGYGRGRESVQKTIRRVTGIS